MSPWIAVAVAVALPVVVVAAGTYLLPRLHTLADGIPFTEVTETDESWLSELPAVDTDTTYRTAQTQTRQGD